jgi:hypothetical protein
MEMIRTRIVEVHGLLHSPKSLHLRVEIGDSLWIRRNSRDVMEADNRMWHVLAPSRILHTVS